MTRWGRLLRLTKGHLEVLSLGGSFFESRNHPSSDRFWRVRGQYFQVSATDGRLWSLVCLSLKPARVPAIADFGRAQPGTSS